MTRREMLCPRCEGKVSSWKTLLCRSCRKELANLKQLRKAVSWSRPTKAHSGLTYSETIVFDNWPTNLGRRLRGCDFQEIQSNALVEVKTNTFSPEQFKEIRERFKSGIPSYLVVVGSSGSSTESRDILILRVHHIAKTRGRRC